MKNIFLSLFLSLFLITACASSSPPKNSADVCKIFKEKRSWYKAAKRTEDRWNIPVSVTMAIIKQESSFIAAAKPPRTKLLGFIPWKRQSSAKGYAQAIDGTWEMYVNERGKWFKSRNDFDDAVDFIGWYTSKSETILKISKQDAFKQYLAYHEGWGNFKHYKKNKKVIGLAKKVEKQSNIYKKQLLSCSNSLNKNKYIIF